MRILLISLFTIGAALGATSNLEVPSWPASFEPNRGQADKRFSYLAHTRSMTMLLNGGGMLAAGKGFELRIDLTGANGRAVATGVKPQEGVSNYLTDPDQSKWVRGVPHFGGVSFRSVYPGIDAVYYGAEGMIEYDFDIAPGADPTAIRLKFSGARRVSLTADGDLLIDTGSANMRMKRPVAYQEKKGIRMPVEVAYRLEGGRAHFNFGKYDQKLKLVIDPRFDYISYYNGMGRDEVRAMTSDDHYIYMCADFSSPQFGFSNPQPKRLNKGDGGIAIVAFFKGTPNISGPQTFLASANEGCAAMAPGPIPNTVWMAGITYSSDYQVTDGSKNHGSADAYLSLLSPFAGQYAYSTYLGGSGSDYINALIPWNGGVIVVGNTTSTDFPVTGSAPISSKLQGVEDGFFSYYKPSGNLGFELAYSSYLGGSNADEAWGVASAGNTIVIAGHTNSTDFPITPNAMSKTNHGGIDLFVTTLDFDGNTASLIYSTYIGGSADDRLTAMKPTHQSPGVIIGGYTNSSDFPTTEESIPLRYGGGKDAFLLHLDPINGVLVWSTYVGGSKTDDLSAIDVDPQDGVWAAGTTMSTDFPNSSQQSAPTDSVTWVFHFDPLGEIGYGDFIGANYYVIPNALLLDPDGNLWGGGVTAAQTLPVTNLALNPNPAPDTSPFTSTTDGFYFFLRSGSQPTRGCDYDLSSPGDLTDAAQDVTLNLTTTFAGKPEGSCAWRIVNGGTFTTVDGPTTGKGDATITVKVPKNDTKATRQAAIYVGPRLALIRQSALDAVPAIYDGGVVGAALSIPSLRRLAFNGLFTVFGTDLAPKGTALGAQLINGSLSTILGGVCVTFNGAQLPLINVYSGQITAIAPLQTGDADINAEIRVLNGCDTPNPISSNAQIVPYGKVAPEFLYFKTTANDGSPVAAVDAITGAPIGPSDLFPGQTSPAKPDSIVTIYAVGFGDVTPSIYQGQPALVASKVVAPAKVFLNGKQMDDADVQYVGVTVGSVGLYQVNLHIPVGTSPGKLPLKIDLGDQESPAGAYLTIGSK